MHIKISADLTDKCVKILIASELSRKIVDGIVFNKLIDKLESCEFCYFLFKRWYIEKDLRNNILEDIMNLYL